MIERGDAEEVVANPRHPYTRLLISFVPMPDPRQRWGIEIDLAELT